MSNLAETIAVWREALSEGKCQSGSRRSESLSGDFKVLTGCIGTSPLTWDGWSGLLAWTTWLALDEVMTTSVWWPGSARKHWLNSKSPVKNNLKIIK